MWELLDLLLIKTKRCNRGSEGKEYFKCKKANINYMSILGNYGVKFVVQDIFGEKLKTVTADNGLLSSFLLEHHLIEVKDLLDALIELLIGELTLLEKSTQSLTMCVASPTETKFFESSETWYNNSNATPDFVLPTSDFKVIVEAWRDYLAS